MSWLDSLRDYLAERTMPWTLILVAMVTVFTVDVLWIAGVETTDTAALATGLAAVISALAAVIEARRGGAMRDHLADHEARLRVLEDRGRRP